MKDGQWYEMDRNNNCYTSMMKLGASVLIKIGIYDDEKDVWLSASVVEVSYQDIPKHWYERLEPQQSEEE